MELYDRAIQPEREGWVYLIHADGTNRYKIGRSTNPIKRHQVLQKQSPYPLVVAACFHSLDAVMDEAKLHDSLEDYRTYGEWFILQPEVIANFIQEVFFSCKETELIGEAFKILNFHKVKFSESNFFILARVLKRILDKNPYIFCTAVDSLEFAITTHDGTNFDDFVMGYFRGVNSAMFVFDDRNCRNAACCSN